MAGTYQQPGLGRRPAAAARAAERAVRDGRIHTRIRDAIGGTPHLSPGPTDPEG